MKLAHLDALLDSGLPLPDAVRASAVAARAVAALAVPPSAPRPPDVRTVHAEVVTACVVAAERGKAKLPDAARLRDAVKAGEDWNAEEAIRLEQRRLLVAAQTEALTNAGEVLGEHHAAVIATASDALDEVMVEAREVVPLVRGFTMSTALRAGDEIRQGWVRLDELCARYSSIRTVQHLATDAAGGCRLDTGNYFGQFRNMPALYPNTYSRMHATPPWPADLRDFIVWCVEHPDHELWCPTPAERDAEFERQIGQKTAGRMGYRVVGA